MRIRPVGAHALLIDCAGADQVEAWRAELWRRRDRGELTAVEIVPAATTVLLDGVPDPATTAARIAAWQPGPDAPGAPGGPPAASASAPGGPPAASGPAADPAVAGGPITGGSRGDAGIGADGVGLVEVPVTYDGEDLPIVADHWGVAVPAVVDRLRRTRFRVAFCGFAPGFAYLSGLPAELAVPRLSTPRPRVPAGAVALAGPYAGIYPAASPGGWLLVGRTGMSLFDVHADPPARLTPGTRVRLVAA
ncbi:allophanate hydrolase subunit 1 [Micromonospora sp. C31]|uniref:5-oxoprolinase subunit B family protein n=1 Tax=Micromonospora sp. C31 TaxID=2824876 RepID=UPI001B393215|nr:carboxyltransferase domain-containing protein [Micromonospora sp. C31]MBQ1074194.1 allophanate hydrolase subunit 1 [Micromonospora sp. C31]